SQQRFYSRSFSSGFSCKTALPFFFILGRRWDGNQERDVPSSFFQRPLGDGLAMGFQMGETMKRRDFIKVTGLGTAGAATFAAPAIAQSMPELKWRMTASWPKSLDTIYGGADVMCKAVAEATDNKFKI